MAPQFDPTAIQCGSHHKYLSSSDSTSSVCGLSCQKVFHSKLANIDFLDMLDRTHGYCVESMLDSHVGDNKFRQLPCRTYISAGTCPYRDRCVYLHDPRVMSKSAKSTTRRKNKDELTGDAFFWPTMSRASVMGRQDGECKPHVIQHYELYSSQSLPLLNSAEKAAYSMWYHFVDNCRRINNNTEFNVAHLMNPVDECTFKPRLPIFVSLATGQTARASAELSATVSQSVSAPAQLSVPSPPAPCSSKEKDSKSMVVELLPSRHAVRPATNAAAVSGYFSPVRSLQPLGSADRNSSPVSIAEGSFFDSLPPLIPYPIKKSSLQIQQKPSVSSPPPLSILSSGTVSYQQQIVLFPIAQSIY